MKPDTGYIKDIDALIKKCQRGNRNAQLNLYKHFYSKTYAVCQRYAKNDAEAKFILNEGWLRVFMSIGESSKPFEEWLNKKIIDHAVKLQKKVFGENSIPSTFQQLIEEPVLNKDLNYEQVLKAVQSLSADCRVVFCLVVIDQYSKKEIFDLLNIDKERLEYCLAKARINLIKQLKKKKNENLEKNNHRICHNICGNTIYSIQQERTGYDAK